MVETSAFLPAFLRKVRIFASMRIDGSGADGIYWNKGVSNSGIEDTKATRTSHLLGLGQHIQLKKDLN